MMTREPNLPEKEAPRRGARLLAQSTLAAATLAIVCAGISGANGGERGGFPHQGIEGKAGYCTDCHGPSGRGYRGFYVMPRLAGQTPEYFENQLRAFVAGRRGRHSAMVMSKVHGLGPGMRSALAAHFAGLSPRSFGGGPRELVATGRQIYEEGLPEANVPACSVCHGPDAKGHGPIPRLAGQLFSYTVKQLASWDESRGQNGATADTSGVMRPVAHSLSKSQIAAVAAYLSYLD
jgi:cytochrome c553